MPEMVAVSQVARELAIHPSRVRALIADGSLRAEKVGGRWLVHWDSVVARRREPTPAGRPLAAHNAWSLLLAASREAAPDGADSVSSWRVRQTLAHPGLAAVRRRLDRRAELHRLWALPGELRALHADDALVLTGASAAGALHLQIASPDVIDAYVPARRLTSIVREYGLEEAPASQANVLLRAVPDDAWVLGERRIAPRAAVAVDLASYADSRSARAGMQLLDELARAAEPA